MMKSMIAIPVMLLVIVVAMLFLGNTAPETAGISASDATCAIPGNLSASDQARIDSLTSGQDKDYLVEDFSG